MCDDCQETLLRRWVAEERRLLRGMPDYAEEVVTVIEKVAATQMRIWLIASRTSVTARSTGVEKPN